MYITDQLKTNYYCKNPASDFFQNIHTYQSIYTQYSRCIGSWESGLQLNIAHIKMKVNVQAKLLTKLA